METSENIKSYYQDYISIYKDETDRLKQFKTFIDKTESDQLFDRKNFVGHITGSAIIFDYKNSKVLLIKHIILQRWLQPGGHIEKTDASILDGVLLSSEKNSPSTSTRIPSPRIRPNTKNNTFITTSAIFLFTKEKRSRKKAKT